MNKVTITEKQFAGIPTLHFSPGAANAPLIVLFHRFTASPALDANLGYMAARAGFNVICPEALMHASRFDGDERQRRGRFWQILHDSLDTLPAILDDYQRQGLSRSPLTGLLGSSMGGFTVLGAMRRYPWIHAGAALMSSGYFSRTIKDVHPPAPSDVPQYLSALQQYDIEGQESLLARRPLFVWHGLLDDVVSAHETVRLRDTLNQQGAGEYLQCVIDPHTGHKVTQEAATTAVAFLSRALLAVGKDHDG